MFNHLKFIKVGFLVLLLTSFAGMQVFTIEKVGNLHECMCVASKASEASNMSEASPNSWGFGGAVSPPSDQ